MNVVNNKYYENIKQYIKNNYKFLIVILISITVLLWPVDYHILTGGGIISIESRLSIDTEYDADGSLNFSYVREARGTVTSYLLSFIFPSWERIRVSDLTIHDDEDIQDLRNRSLLDLSLNNNHATFQAFYLADRDIEIESTRYYVYHVNESAIDNTLRVGDQILSFNGNEMTSFEELREYINTKEEGDTLSFNVLSNNRQQTRQATIFETDGELFTGIVVVGIHEFKTDPTVELNFTANESGPSGGLMLTLAIYNHLVKDDITNGLTIVGTGAIDQDGNAREVGGISFKLSGAVRANADVFIVPVGENYEEAVSVRDANNWNIEIIGVESVHDAIEQLTNYR